MADHEEAGEVEEQIAPKDPRFPLKVVYCPECGLPADYCEFGPDFNKCKPWLLANFPDLYPQLKETGVEELVDKLKVSESKEEKKEEVKILPGGKVKKIVKETPRVSVSRAQRNKRKWVTSVAGLSGFGIKLSDASKLFSKKFAASASVSKETPDAVDVQGDVQDEMVDFILLTWKDKITEDSVVVVEDNKKPPSK